MLYCVFASPNFPFFLFFSIYSPLWVSFHSSSVRMMLLRSVRVCRLVRRSPFTIRRSPFVVHRSPFVVRIHVLSLSSPFSFPSSFAFAPPLELISSVHVRVSHLHCCHVQSEEKDASVRASALSYLLYFVCDRGKIWRNRLVGLDIKVLKALVRISRENSWAELVH
ncbi:uncharacterized protein LOC114168268 [Vigna unguiculata]|uniref:uncharacterized protein LOC114168268 n=1 Tax=Vigna unguiculata TaxID=3917 RepID=UPI0010163A9E|nr:uncharacterized protein LOC114168268 [Vigna unguiculata]